MEEIIVEEIKIDRSKKDGYKLVAGAIVLAGILIAGAILLKGGSSNNNGIKSISEELGLRQSAFAKCRTEGEAKKVVQANQESGLRAGAQGTPYTVLLAKDGKKYVLNGAYPYEQTKKILDDILAGTAKESKDINLDPIGPNEFINGNPNADIIAVEYSDPECPFSKRFHSTMLQVMKDYNGKVAWVFRFFPLSSIHQKAQAESEAIQCAGTLKGGEMYWRYLDRIFELTPSNDGLDPRML